MMKRQEAGERWSSIARAEDVAFQIAD